MSTFALLCLILSPGVGAFVIVLLWIRSIERAIERDRKMGIDPFAEEDDEDYNDEGDEYDSIIKDPTPPSGVVG